MSRIPGLPERIRSKMAAGELPSEPPEATRTGFGEGSLCSVCGVVIGATQLECEVEYADRRTWRMHHGCHRIWQARLTGRPGR